MTRCSRRSQALAVAGGVGVALAFASAPALALPGEWHAGARAGIATLHGGSLGPAVDVHGAYELTDMFDAVVQVTGSRHGGASGTDVLSASGGLAYKIDVFEWIPYIGILGGYYRYAGPRGASYGAAGLSFHAGLDYLAARQLALGFDFGFNATFEDRPRTLNMTALIGAEYRFGW